MATLALGLVGTMLVAAADRVIHGSGVRVARMARLPGMVALLQSDRAIICGGGYMYSSRRVVNLTLAHALVQIRLATALGKRPAMMPQSLGPLPKALDRWMVRRCLRHVNPIVVRDIPAEREAHALFRNTSQEIMRCPDVALYGSDKIESHPARQSDATRIGVVVMDWTWARPVDPVGAMTAYIERLANVIAALAGGGYHVTLFGHSHVPEQAQDDLAVARRLGGVLSDRAVAIDVASEARDPDALKDTFAHLDLVIGTRLHSCILSLSARTPAIALAYQPKTVGTYAMLGLDDLCHDVENFDWREIVALTHATIGPGSAVAQRIDNAVRAAHHAIDALYTEVLAR